MAETVVDTGSVDTGGSETLSSEQAAADLDSWANQPIGRPRQDNGKFKAKTDSDPSEVKRVLKDSIKGLARQPKLEDEADEEQVEEEQEEVEPKPKPKTGRKVLAKVNGQEEEIDLDDDEFQKVNAVQATRAAQKAWREAAEMRKESQQLRKALEDAKSQVGKDPMALFRALGISDEQVSEFARNRTIEQLSETIDPNTGQPYTPEQQRIIQLQKELRNKEQTEQQRAQQIEAAEMEQLKDVVRKDIDRKFTSALQETGLPATQYTMMRLADLMQSMGPDVDPQTVAPLVLEDMVNEVRQTIYSMPLDVAAEILGEEWLGELRKWDIGKARQGRDKFGRNPQTDPNNSTQRTQPRGRTGPITNPNEAQDFLEKWADGKA